MDDLPWFPICYVTAVYRTVEQPNKPVVYATHFFIINMRLLVLLQRRQCRDARFAKTPQLLTFLSSIEKSARSSNI